MTKVIPNNMTSTFTTDTSNLTSFELRVSLGISMSLVCLGSILGNLLVLISMVKQKPLPDGSSLIFINLAICNLLLALVGEPFVIVSLFAGHWVWTDPLRVFEAMWVESFGLTSMMILSLMSFEQYSRFILLRQLHTKQILMIILFMYAISFMLGVSPLFGWSEYAPEGLGVSNSISWKELSTSSGLYIMIVMFCGYINPLFVIVYCYTTIYKSVKFQLNEILVKTNIGDNVISLRIHNNHSSVLQEKQLAIAVILVVLSFYAAWTPYAITNLINMSTPWVTEHKIVGTVMALVAKSSTLWWPGIYTMSDRRVYKACRKTVRGIKRWIRVWYFSL